MGPYNYYDYGYGYGYAESAAEGVAGFMLVFFLVFYLLMLAVGVASYVLQSLGMYTIAKRRGIHHPWLSWVPVGNMWLLGSISDQYQYVAKGRVRNRRKVLLGLTIAMYALMILVYVSMIFTAISGAASASAGEMMVGATIAIMLLACLALFVVAIIAVVFQYMALYDLFASCDPGNAVLYLVLSIVFGVVLPFFIFACRKKDLGMPPRKPVQPVQPVFQPTWRPVQSEPAPQPQVVSEETAQEVQSEEDPEPPEQETQE